MEKYTAGKYPLWEGKAPGAETEIPTLEFYPPIHKKSNAAVIIFAGGGYSIRNRYEDFSYAQFINNFGLTAFVVNYRLTPAHFPDQLLDARRAVRFIRANAERFSVDPQGLVVMGSSAGGHLASLVSTFRDRIEGEGVDEIDEIDPIPNGQALCYPVISTDDEITHKRCLGNLMPGELHERRHIVSTDRLVTAATPPASSSPALKSAWMLCRSAQEFTAATASNSLWMTAKISRSVTTTSLTLTATSAFANAKAAAGTGHGSRTPPSKR